MAQNESSKIQLQDNDCSVFPFPNRAIKKEYIFKAGQACTLCPWCTTRGARFFPRFVTSAPRVVARNAEIWTTVPVVWWSCRRLRDTSGLTVVCCWFGLIRRWMLAEPWRVSVNCFQSIYIYKFRLIQTVSWEKENVSNWSSENSLRFDTACVVTCQTKLKVFKSHNKI